MNPQTIRNFASALILFSLISVSLMTGTGNAGPQKRSVTLSARITDEGGSPIPGAHISIFQGEQHLGQGDADTRGIVQVEIAVNAAGPVKLVLEVSKPGMLTKPHKMELGTSFPTRLPLEEIELKADAARADTILSIKVVDNDREVSGALVEVNQNSVPVGRANTNADGVAQITISVKPNEPLAVRASKQGLQPGSSTINLGANIPQRLPLEEITLQPVGSGDDERFLLTVKAVDAEGKGIKQAHVNIYVGSYTFGTDSFVRPPTFQEDTNAHGMWVFEIPVKPGQKNFETTIEVSREDLQTERRTITIRPDLVPLSQVETIAMTARNPDSTVASANIKVTVSDIDGPLLEGALVKIINGTEWTNSVRNTPHQNHTGTNGSATVAVELFSTRQNVGFDLVVSKPGYKEFKQVVWLDNRSNQAVGTTTEAVVWLDKAPAGASTIEVKVTVLDSQTNNGVPDADVILDGAEYKTATTDASGVVTLTVKEPGSYVVRLSQDNYWPIKDREIRVLATGASPEPFRLIRKPTKDAAGDTIEVTVLAQEHADTKDKPRPLKNAWVSDGRQTTMTDAGGKATLRGAYALDHAVTVTADSYEPSTQRVRIMRPMLSTATGRATFILKPALNDNTPIRLIVEVIDDRGRPVPGAGVEFFRQGRSLFLDKTNEKGERDFRSSDTNVPLAELRKGITLDVILGTKKVVVNRQVPADLLKPSIVATRFQVALQRDWSELRKAIEALEAKVFAWNKDLKDSTAGFQTFKDMASTAEGRAKVLETEITALLLAISSVANGPSLCGQAAPYLIRIPNLETQVKQKEQELKQKIDRATMLTKTCSTLNDPELIRSGYRDAIRLLGEMGKLEKQAVADRNALLVVAKKNSDAFAVIREARRKFPELPKLQALAKENWKTAVMRAQTQSDLSKALISRQLTLKAELSVLSVKAFSEGGVPDELLERITVMEGILSARNKGAHAPELVPRSVEEAPAEIRYIEDRVARVIKALDNAICPVSTLDDVVKGMGTIVFNSGLEIGLASDLPKLADACAAKAANKTTAPPIKPATTSKKSDPPVTVQNNPPTSIQDDPPANDKTVADPPTGDQTTNSPNTTNTTNTTKTTQTTAPAQSNNQPPSSGGFWDTAKKSGKNVKDTITNQPTTGGNSTAANRDPNTGNKPNNKPANPPLTVEAIPEDTTTTVAVNKPASGPGKKPPVVEDIPEDNTNSTTTNNRNKANKPLTVEDIPEDSTNSTTANNTNKSNKPLTVEDIPETAPPNNSGSNRDSASGGKEKLPPGLKRDANGRLLPKDGWEWVNPNDPKDTRVKKKPRDPNKPDFGTWLGGVVREAITGQPNPGVTNNPGSGGGGGGNVSAGGLNLAGTWNVTTQSTGDEELQQNWTRTNVWHIWDLGGGRWRVRQVINGQTYDEVHSTVDYGSGSFRLISTFMGDTVESSGTYNQSQFQVSSSQGQNRVTITARRQ